MTLGQARQAVKDLRKKLAEYLEQQPCTDAISRQAVLDLVNADWKYENLESDVVNLPHVTPQPKTGYWTIKQYQVPIENKQVPTVSGITFPTEPTACKIVYTYTHRACKSKKYLNKYNYCPNCGAKMQEVEE